MVEQLIEITGIGSAAANTLMNHGFKSVISIADATIEELSAVPGFSAVRAGKTIAAAKQLLNSKAAGSNTAAAKTTAAKTTAAEVKTPGNEEEAKNLREACPVR